MSDLYADLKARYLAAAAAEEPRDLNAEIDYEREQELMHLSGAGRGYLTPEERAELKRIRERQEVRARARAQARREAERKAEAAKRDERQRAEVAAEQARVRPILRASFVGTDAEFEERWPQLWARYRDRQALDAAAAGQDAALEEKRRQYGAL